ncbi:lytic transglycosylase domain-containing protein [Sphingopyxis sp. LARHCG72]
MASLKALFVAALLLAASPARADPVAQWRPHIAEASVRFGVPAMWIERVMRAESGGRTTLHGRPITSRAGAMGLMQLMPGTWKSVRERLGLGSDPHDPRDNIMAGTYYLRLMHDRFGYPGLFAAYNAGPGRYAAYLAGRSRLPAETLAYLGAVTGEGFDHRARAKSSANTAPDIANPAAPVRGGRIDPHATIFFIHRPRS